MQDPRALAEELNTICERFTELDTELTRKLTEFKFWLQAEFPKPATDDFYTSHLPPDLSTVFHARTILAGLSTEEPTNVANTAFQFRDEDGDELLLPLAWLEDPAAFRESTQKRVQALRYAREASQPARQEKFKALSEARARVSQLERELSSNA